ncbi:putative mitochondrial hypothetical protein [Leptomonas pyrrhocoris]|uniref:Uncharacterized protein n=1 Tax=Leptomonas pyrrhocoris TaxID=157538 RepID=A0A0N0DX69_LEPPY|nr:putative mitochondrial hypothetical protein [Leptomonas pyrrhocoris]XP_015661051.1 putative mitochondrial hypothetical protein [Leptomonas pyrrhocoris]KPA82611.1 putative mitochondrial hypothetical protein [Leptomonas pyrrhocoris]KPA82612.1 putative mitochondrial hypothetical protein [Leptomonas pyrrhocoris]|eukprot:XP_015661050.1 putative mitochondrial hypothetical protein [Leptomonas pyrrhocoris]
MKPKAAQVRQQQSLNRRAKLEESAARVQQDLYARQALMRNMAGGQQGNAMYGRPVRNSDPNRGVITQAEWDELVERHEDSGKCFRYFFGILILLCLLLLAFSKYDEEYNLEVPQVESGRGFGELLNPDRFSSTTETAATSKEELEHYYHTLGVDGRLNLSSKDGHAAAATAVEENAEEDPDKARRRENYVVRQQIKHAFATHQEKQGQLVHCGRTCEAENKQVELAYNKLVSQVDRELFKVLLDANDTMSVRSTTPAQLKKKYEEKRQRILETEKDEVDRNMALEELKDAYDIIENADARKYYLLYGAKPPEQMRHVSARHGGWGQEMALGTFKFRIIIMWLDFLHTYLGVWGETFVLGSVVLFVLSRLPQALADADRLLDQFDLQDEHAEKEKKEATKAE